MAPARTHNAGQERDLARGAQWLREADAVVVAAGAGMGVDSGLPDFRGPEGFWRAYPALAHRGLRFEAMAQPRWFLQDPGLAWAFYGHRLNLYRRTVPHAGFGQLLALARTKPAGEFVFTSNVDGHFQKAGFAPEAIVECHGSLLHLQCQEPCSDAIWDAPPAPIDIDEVHFQARRPWPQCPHCGGIARPNVQMFGDDRWAADRTLAQEARFGEWLAGVRAGGARVVVVEMGAGTAVPSVRHMSEELVRLYGARLLRINPREPEVPAGQLGLPLGAAAALGALLPGA